MPKAEGRIFKWEEEEKIRKDFLETIDFKDSEQYIRYDTKEFSAVCPFSGLPDVGQVVIEYYPKDCIIELKSLKYYLISFRNVGIYQEKVTTRIYEDLKSVLGTDRLKVTTIYNIRGGIETTCVRGVL